MLCGEGTVPVKRQPRAHLAWDGLSSEVPGIPAQMSGPMKPVAFSAAHRTVALEERAGESVDLGVSPGESPGLAAPPWAVLGSGEFGLVALIRKSPPDEGRPESRGLRFVAWGWAAVRRPAPFAYRSDSVRRIRGVAALG